MLSIQQRGSALFALPLGLSALVYAPLHRVAALLNHTGVTHLRRALSTGASTAPDSLRDLAGALSMEPDAWPAPKTGPFSPLFLGLLPTRGCNFACRYCDFLPVDPTTTVMAPELVRDAVTWYMNLVRRNGETSADIHYFGGEPFCAPEVIDLSVHLARRRAAEAGCDVRFEVSTNGAFSERRAQWAADTMDTVVRSFDGPADIHDYHRPYRGGGASFDTVQRTAGILSEGPTDLFLRSCVTAQTVDRVATTARWFAETYRPKGVCFEPLLPTPQARDAGLEPPDPWRFAAAFTQAARILESYGIEPVYAAADIRARRVSFCPVAQDVAIVSPDGRIHACYLLPHEWEAQGFNFTLGRIEQGVTRLDMDNVDRVRAHNVTNRPFCERCFARWHCAGGCHVNHPLPEQPGTYDRLCIQTRIVTLRNILHALGQDDLMDRLFAEQEHLEHAILRPSDSVTDWESLP